MIYKVVVNVYPGSMLARVYYNRKLIGSIKDTAPTGTKCWFAFSAEQGWTVKGRVAGETFGSMVGQVIDHHRDGERQEQERIGN